MTAIQIFPVVNQIATSVRREGSGPSLLYDISRLPYRVFEFVWPNVFGGFWAGNRYWMALLPPSAPAPAVAALSLRGGAAAGPRRGAGGFRRKLSLAGLDDGCCSAYFLGQPGRFRRSRTLAGW